MHPNNSSSETPFRTPNASPSSKSSRNAVWDILIIGSGAAGFMAALSAAKAQPQHRILLIDGSPKPGTKILIAGGGRCNVTHESVNPEDYNGATSPSIRKILGRFGVDATLEFFKELGVELKQEETGKFFPVTDKAKTVLEALEKAIDLAGVVRRFPCRVETLEKIPSGFRAIADSGAHLDATCVVLATGGKSLPKTGSDGMGYSLAQGLGHSLTPQILPALVPLMVEEGHFIRSLSGLTLPTALEIRSESGKRLYQCKGSTLLTHFGLSGPAILDISRHWLTLRNSDPRATFHIDWLPNFEIGNLDSDLIGLGKTSVLAFLRKLLPERLALAISQFAGIDPRAAGDQLPRNQRKALIRSLKEMPTPIQGTKGFALAEVTAGGLPLSEFHLKTLESRLCPNLFTCGEILDVDGRIGGFNFQWAWASGHVAGLAAAQAVELLTGNRSGPNV